MEFWGAGKTLRALAEGGYFTSNKDNCAEVPLSFYPISLACDDIIILYIPSVWVAWDSEEHVVWRSVSNAQILVAIFISIHFKTIAFPLHYYQFHSNAIIFHSQLFISMHFHHFLMSSLLSSNVISPVMLCLLSFPDDCLGLTASDDCDQVVSALGACVWCLKRYLVDHELLSLGSFEVHRSH